MDLTNGITQMQGQLKPDAFGSYQSGANAFATAQKQGQEIASNKIKNENALREQEIQTRLQKAIEESFDPVTGQPDYNKMATNGHKYGISAQQMDYSIKHLKENWSSIAETALNKQTIESTAKKGWNSQSPKAPATNTVAPSVAETTATSKGVAPATTITDTAKSVEPTNNPYTNPDPFASEAEISKAKSEWDATHPQIEQPAPNSGMSQIPELTGAQKALTGADGGLIQGANGLISGLSNVVTEGANPNSQPIPTQLRGSLAQDVMGNTQQIGTGQVSQPATTISNGSSEANPMALGQQVITATAPVTQPAQAEPARGGTLYQNANDMEVNDYSGLGGDGLGDGKVPTTISNYTIPRNVYTDSKGNIQTYTQDELNANPNLDIGKSAESFFRSQSGDNTSAPDVVARNYLQSVYDNAMSANRSPVAPPRPIKATPENMDKWRSETAKWQNENAKASGIANGEVQKVKDLVAKGRFDLAGKILDTQKDSILLVGDDRTYRARNTKSRDAVAAFELLEPMATHLSSELSKLDSSDYTSMKLLIPQYARIMGGRMSPEAQISMGNIGESEASAMVSEAQHAGLTMGGALAAMADYFTNPTRTFSDVVKGYIGSAINNIKVDTIRDRMQAGLKASKESTERYKEENLIGYKRKVKGGESASDLPTAPTDTEYTPKTGWYNQPMGTRFKLDPEDPNSQMGMVTDATKNDVTGESRANKVKLDDGSLYTVNEGDPESEDVELVPWSKQSPKGPIKPAKKGAKKSGITGPHRKATASDF